MSGGKGWGGGSTPSVHADSRQTGGPSTLDGPASPSVFVRVCVRPSIYLPVCPPVRVSACECAYVYLRCSHPLRTVTQARVNQLNHGDTQTHWRGRQPRCTRLTGGCLPFRRLLGELAAQGGGTVRIVKTTFTGGNVLIGTGIWWVAPKR